MRDRFGSAIVDGQAHKTDGKHRLSRLFLGTVMWQFIFGGPKLILGIYFSTKDDSFPPGNNSFVKPNFHKKLSALVSGIPINEPGCIVRIGAGPSLVGESLDLMTGKDGWRVKKSRRCGERCSIHTF
jgi:hypothetical protein